MASDRAVAPHRGGGDALILPPRPRKRAKTQDNRQLALINAPEDDPFKFVEVGRKDRKGKEVLEEQVFEEGLSRIIERDYFPDLKRLRLQLKLLEAMDSGDPRVLREVCAKVEEMLGDKEKDEAPSPSQDELASLSVNNFLTRFTSEDNASFAELAEQAKGEHRRKYWWLYHDARQHFRDGRTAQPLAAIEDVARGGDGRVGGGGGGGGAGAKRKRGRGAAPESWGDGSAQAKNPVFFAVEDRKDAGGGGGGGGGRGGGGGGGGSGGGGSGGGGGGGNSQALVVSNGAALVASNGVGPVERRRREAAAAARAAKVISRGNTRVDYAALGFGGVSLGWGLGGVRWRAMRYSAM